MHDAIDHYDDIQSYIVVERPCACGAPEWAKQHYVLQKHDPARARLQECGPGNGPSVVRGGLAPWVRAALQSQRAVCGVPRRPTAG